MKGILLAFSILISNMAFAENIIVFGDTGKATAGQRLVAEQLKNECPGHCSRVFLLGDNIYPEGITSPNDPLMKKTI